MKKPKITAPIKLYNVSKVIVNRFMAVYEAIRELNFTSEGELGEKCGGLTQMQVNIIRFVGHHRRPSMREIAKNANITLGSVTQAIDVLAAKKYVRRVRSENDRRVVYTELAPRGKKLYQIIKKHMADIAAEFLRNFTPAEQKKVLNYFIKLKN